MAGGWRGQSDGRQFAFLAGKPRRQSRRCRSRQIERWPRPSVPRAIAGSRGIHRHGQFGAFMETAPHCGSRRSDPATPITIHSDARTVRAFYKERLQRGFASDQLASGASPPVSSNLQFHGSCWGLCPQTPEVFKAWQGRSMGDSNEACGCIDRRPPASSTRPGFGYPLRSCSSQQ